jgi:hypothetical protein
VLNYGILLKNYIINIMPWLCTMEESATRNNQVCIVTGPISNGYQVNKAFEEYF